jgi:hypothetical protein
MVKSKNAILVDQNKNEMKKIWKNQIKEISHQHG